MARHAISTRTSRTTARVKSVYAGAKGVAKAVKAAGTPPLRDTGRPELPKWRKNMNRALPLLVGAAIVTRALNPEPVPINVQPEPHPPLSAPERADVKRWADAEVLAAPFDQCGITNVTDLHHRTKVLGRDTSGTTTLAIDVLAPISGQAAGLYGQYSKSKTITWGLPVGVGVVFDPKKPDQLSPLTPVTDDNAPGASDVKNGQGHFNLYPRTDYPAGTKIGVYVLNTVQTESMDLKWQLAGVTPCGELELQKPDGGPATWEIYRGPHTPMVPLVEATQVGPAQ